MKQTEKILFEAFLKCKGISTDSRTVNKGQLYFALQGDNFDGNSFAEDALKKGAINVVIDKEEYNNDKRCILVDDVLESLQKLANKWRKSFNIPVIGITGTNGKTTTKELLHSVLNQGFKVHATAGNYNNHIGVPLTLLKLKKEDEIAIIEMGASGNKEIKLLCEIAEPTMGIVTNVGKAHIEGFGSEEVIAITKRELYDYLDRTGGVPFISSGLLDNPFFKEKDYDWETFDAQMMNGPGIRSVLLTSGSDRLIMTVQMNDGRIAELSSTLYGHYNFENIIAVMKIADKLGLDIELIKQGIENYVPSNNRSQVVSDDRSNTIVLDAYNANPTSMNAALDHFDRTERQQDSFLILGDMLELGEISDKEHLEIVDRLLKSKARAILLVGSEFYKIRERADLDIPEKIFFFQNVDEANTWWESQIVSGAFIFVKGSRGIALEKMFE